MRIFNDFLALNSKTAEHRTSLLENQAALEQEKKREKQADLETVKNGVGSWSWQRQCGVLCHRLPLQRLGNEEIVHGLGNRTGKGAIPEEIMQGLQLGVVCLYFCIVCRNYLLYGLSWFV